MPPGVCQKIAAENRRFQTNIYDKDTKSESVTSVIVVAVVVVVVT